MFSHIHLYILVWCVCVTRPGPLAAAEELNVVEQALEYVTSVTAESCTKGTGNKLPLRFDYQSWARQTDTAIQTANFLSGVLAMDGSLATLRIDMLYAMVRNNVRPSSGIVGSVIAVEEGVVPGYIDFAPFAFYNDTEKKVEAFDLSTASYNYKDSTTEWYTEVKSMSRANVNIVSDVVEYNESDPGSTVILTQPVVTYKDGRWTYPYFDCGAGDIWMTTYSSPILQVDNTGAVRFKGVATIDIELTNLDINQCDVPNGQSALGLFSGTHSCQPTTVCVPLSEGFRAGGYQCECAVGYYFPDTSASLRAFSGRNIEQFLKTTDGDGAVSQFQCLPCARDCDKCTDGSPCIEDINYDIHIVVVVVVGVMIAGCLLVALVTLNNTGHPVMKMASPFLLVLVCLGAVLMCVSVILLYGEATGWACSAQIWLLHIGFAVMYGALLLMAWRKTAIIASADSSTAPGITNAMLLLRMVLLVLLMVGYLTAWTVVDQPETEKVTGSNLRYFVCEESMFNYALYGAEALLLLACIWLYVSVDKYITLSMFNALVLGCGAILLIEFVGRDSGPDEMYALLMVQQVVMVAVTVVLVFVPKFWSMRNKSKGHEYENNNKPVQTELPGNGNYRL